MIVIIWGAIAWCLRKCARMTEEEEAEKANAKEALERQVGYDDEADE